VVPLSSSPTLLPDEEVSLRHLRRHLGRYDTFFAAPASSRLHRAGIRTKRFPDKFFGSVAAHNHLLFWPRFYRAFASYDYLFVYHLDSLVFSDQLLQWCRAGFDYVGAPWIPGPDTPWVTEPRVGNGGFTLVRIESVLRILRQRHRREPLSFVSDLVMRNRRGLDPVYRMLEAWGRRRPGAALVTRALAHRDRGEHPAEHGMNNDWFLSCRGNDYLPGFRIATVEEGLRFAFEASPRTCFELAGRRLPFGCHAWTRYDRSFWEPFLLPENTANAPGD
jgi:hypothetical protein